MNENSGKRKLPCSVCRQRLGVFARVHWSGIHLNSSWRRCFCFPRCLFIVSVRFHRTRTDWLWTFVLCDTSTKCGLAVWAQACCYMNGAGASEGWGSVQGLYRHVPPPPAGGSSQQQLLHTQGHDFLPNHLNKLLIGTLRGCRSHLDPWGL